MRARSEGSPQAQVLRAWRELGYCQVHPHPHGPSGKTRLREWLLSWSWWGPWIEGEGRMAFDKICDSLCSALGIPNHWQPRETKNSSPGGTGTGSLRGGSRSLVWSQPGQAVSGPGPLWLPVLSDHTWLGRVSMQPQAMPSPSPSLPGAK